MESICRPDLPKRLALRPQEQPDPDRRPLCALQYKSRGAVNQPYLEPGKPEQLVPEQGGILSAGEWSFWHCGRRRPRAAKSLAEKRERGAQQDVQTLERAKDSGI